MKPLFITGMAISFALTAAMATAGGPWSPEMAADQTPLEEIGRSLFYDPNLGGSINQLSCGSCHANGYLLENAANPDLMRAIRQCFIKELGGSNQDGSEDMRALRAYIQNLAGEPSAPSEDQSFDLLNGFRPGRPESRPGKSGVRPGNRGQRAGQHLND